MFSFVCLEYVKFQKQSEHYLYLRVEVDLPDCCRNLWQTWPSRCLPMTRWNLKYGDIGLQINNNKFNLTGTSGRHGLFYRPYTLLTYGLLSEPVQERERKEMSGRATIPNFALLKSAGFQLAHVKSPVEGLKLLYFPSTWAVQ